MVLPHPPSTSTDDPTQGMPSLEGTGSEQVRLRYRRPPAQVDEHTVQVLQLAQLPSTGHVPDPLQIAVSIALPSHSCPLQLVKV